MKKFIAYILSLVILLLPFPIHSASLFGKAQQVMYRGTITGLRISAVDGTAFIDNLIQTYTGFTCNLSTINGTAFITNPSVSLAGFPVGTKFTLTAGGKTLVGYKKAGGSKESYDSQRVTNGTWDTDTNGWNATGSATLASVSGGQSGNCLQETLTTTGGAANQTGTATIGGLYKWSIYVKQGTITGASYTVGIVYPGVMWLSSLNSINTSSWVQVGKYWAATQASVGFSAETASTSGTALYDEFSCMQVLTPSSTGVTIQASTSDVTQNWASNDGIDPNSASFTLTAEILPILADGTNEIQIYDSAGKMLRGVLKAVGTGETVGSELVDAWTNTVGANGYETFTPGAGTDITQAINSADTYGIAYKVVTSNVGWLTKIVATINIASGGWHSLGGLGPVIGGSQPGVYKVTTTTTGTYGTINAQQGRFAAWQYGAIDYSLSGFSYKQVIAPSTSGATIVSAKAGATYNFGYKDAAFVYNAASYYCIVRKLR